MLNEKKINKIIGVVVFLNHRVFHLQLYKINYICAIRKYEQQREKINRKRGLISTFLNNTHKHAFERYKK